MKCFDPDYQIIPLGDNRVIGIDWGHKSGDASVMTTVQKNPDGTHTVVGLQILKEAES